ncbi:MAG: NADH-quinone oxidoreductase subunit N [Desulfobulbaceae bacterium]|nr:NADH-quinone oxidoreductase subunit N [Desulfobulbaceae bacterium]HIJ89697.1 NADH-quinone oxidoreductase subunit N [Deltaproteobacteria bacterium]
MKTLLLPDLLLVFSAFATLGLDLFMPRSSKAPFHLAWAGALLVFFVLLFLPYDQHAIFWGGYEVNGRGLMYKQLFVLSAAFTILLSGSYFQSGNGRQPLAYQGEFCAIILLATFGMFTVVSATDLLTLLLGMELATIPLYALCAFRKGCPLASEASTKYIIMGSLSTAVAVFGYSFLYGCAGSLRFEAVLAYATQYPTSPLLLLGVILLLAAAGFKLTLFPFHMWAPDVYEGAPAPVTAFLSVSSKATAIAFLAVLVNGPLAPLHDQLQPAFLLLAAITMTVGNLGALKQRNLLRFMAYSSIAQAGYIVLAFAGQGAMAQTSIFYYLLVYAAANYATFFIIAVIGKSRSEELETLQGLGRQNPGLAAVLMLAMFSLAGIPPLAGFTGKFMLFATAAQSGFYGMVLFAALNSTVSLYYYLLIIKEAYITKPASPLPTLVMSSIQRASLIPLTGAMIFLGLLPSVSTAIQKILG